MSTKMYCPICKTELVTGTPCAYETLNEHVCDPNGILPTRDTVVCHNEECDAHTDEIFWAHDGEGHYGGDFRKKYAWIDGNDQPFGSVHRSIYFSCSYHEEDHRFKFGKLTIKRAVAYGSDDFGNKKNKHVSYTIWWKNTLYQSGFRMLHFSLKQFYRVNKIAPTIAESKVRSLKERAAWPKAEWWRKASVLWVRLFHPAIYRRALEK